MRAWLWYGPSTQIPDLQSAGKGSGQPKDELTIVKASSALYDEQEVVPSRSLVRSLMVARPTDPRLRSADLPEVEALTPQIFGIDEHRYGSVRFFRNLPPTSGNALSLG